MPRRADVSRAWLLFLGCVVVLLTHAWHYREFFTDDAYISLRYAERLIGGQGLTWTAGERVEGYSNLTWVLGCAALGSLGIPLPVAARMIGLAGGIAALGAAAYLFRPSRVRSPIPALAAMLAMAVAAPLPIWCVGGLEQPILAGLLAWGMVLGLECGAGSLRTVGAAACLGLATITRPDAPLLVAVALAAMAADRRRRPIGTIAIACGLCLGAQLAFRLRYYGAWLPNPAYAKLAWTSVRVAAGGQYVRDALLSLAGLAVPAVLAVALARGRLARYRVTVFVGPLLAWCVYLVVIGGDFFAGRRQVVVVVVLAALACGELWRGLLCRPTAAMRRVAVPAAVVSLVALALAQTPAEPQNARAAAYRWPQRGETVGGGLRQVFGKRQPLLAVEAAGSLPFFSKFPALDMLGLNDRTLARRRPADFGTGILGHELGDAQYVLLRQPDLIVFCNARGRRLPCHRGARDLWRSPDFRRGYKLVDIQFVPETPATPVRARVWMRIASPKVGLQRDPTRIGIPGHFFSRRDAPATIEDSGRLAVRLPPGGALRFGGIALESGTWTAALKADGEATLCVGPRRGGPAQQVCAPGTTIVQRPSGDVAVEMAVEIRATAGPIVVHGVTLRRMVPP